MFYADLHVHSRFSRATSQDCDLERLAIWAAKKGIAVVGTGDFTHPGWFEEIQSKLVPAEPGLFRLAPSAEQEAARESGTALPATARFMLQVEISTIYKKAGRTRKVHHLVYAPAIDHARRLSQALARIGNLASDGRPILGLDSRDLLEIVLEAGEGCYLVPAHVWTPWFAVLGSQSGFDSIEDCYGDLAREVFALETGLSSDPAMNWRVSALDRYALVSNSDAHSPPKLGREACAFDTAIDYFAMRRALETTEGYGGTVEFFPEEGKYHFDGHRKCGVCLPPEETRRRAGVCPVCGKTLTLGVMYRVSELADRPDSPLVPPPRAAPFRSLIPLDEILAEVHGVGPQTQTVRRKYEELLARLGPELVILESLPLEDIARAGSSLLVEAIARMRRGQVIRRPGFDGEYGTISLFTEEERRGHAMAGVLFPTSDDLQTSPASPPEQAKESTRGDETDASLQARLETPGASPIVGSSPGESPSAGWPRLAGPAAAPALDPILDGLDPEQRAAAEAVEGAVLVVAGPGTGKTRTLTHRIAHLIAHCGAAPEQCLALTFSRRAAAEMSERLDRLLPGLARRVPVLTFHALGLRLLSQYGERIGLAPGWRVAGDAERAALAAELLAVSEAQAAQWLRRLSRSKRISPTDAPLPAKDVPAADRYQQELRRRGWLDFDDLIGQTLALLQSAPDVLAACRGDYRWVSVDEFQDIDAGQYALVKLLVPAGGNLCAIGDPDQAIYGFRGADPRVFERLREDYPGLRTITLARNYRSTQTIVDAAIQAVAPASLVGNRRLDAGSAGAEKIEIHGCPTDRAEAEFVVHAIERMLGGWSFFSLDSGRAEADPFANRAFADFAVLYRTEAQAQLLVQALRRSGIPFQRRTHDRLFDQPSVRTLVEAMIRLRQEAPNDAPLRELLDQALERFPPDSPRPDAWASSALRRAAAERSANDLAGFLSELALGSDCDLWDPRADRVSLLTLHAAKGLEFPVVFITGCEDGLLPLHWGETDQAAEDEERRLFFVGMTRARNRLILTYARKRHARGEIRASRPSPFLADIQRALAAWDEHRFTRRSPPPSRQRSLFE